MATERCERCGGSGEIKWQRMWIAGVRGCPDCNGTGRVKEDDDTYICPVHGKMDDGLLECPRC